MAKTKDKPAEVSIGEMSLAIHDIFAGIRSHNNYARCLDDALSIVNGYIDTNSYALNAIISGKLKDGGIPKGRMTIFAGESQTGKSFFTGNIIASAQKEGLTCIIFDSECAFDPKSAKQMGVDVTKVLHVPVTSIEDCRNQIFRTLNQIKDNRLDGKFFIAIDSLGNMISEQELNKMEKDKTSKDMGTRAQAMKTLLQTCINLGSVTRTTILATNWVYDDPSAMFPTLEKNIPGGKAVIFLPTVLVQLTRHAEKPADTAEEKNMIAGQKKYAGVTLSALTRKNRLIKQYLTCDVYLSFLDGMHKYHGLKDLVEAADIVQRAGNTFSIDGDIIGTYKNWKDDEHIWEDILLPRLQTWIDENWHYVGTEDKDPEDTGD